MATPIRQIRGVEGVAGGQNLRRYRSSWMIATIDAGIFPRRREVASSSRDLSIEGFDIRRFYGGYKYGKPDETVIQDRSGSAAGSRPDGRSFRRLLQLRRRPRHRMDGSVVDGHLLGWRALIDGDDDIFYGIEHHNGERLRWS
jgi:hypothetical protein